MMTLEKPLSPDVEFSRLLADGYDSLAVRKANPRHYWAHRQEGEEAHYYWGGKSRGAWLNTWPQSA
jgi:hypothetical protein